MPMSDSPTNDRPYAIAILEISPLVPWRDVLIAEMQEMGYEAFEETPGGLKGYILPEYFDENLLRESTAFNIPDAHVKLTMDTLEVRNWNAAWEKAYPVIVVEGCVTIRAPFHDPLENGLPEVVIQPQMSFGTGHHPTTHLMAAALFEMPLEQKRVLDMGTGTGVLAILAEQRGAEEVLAVDNDAWSTANALDNVNRNRCRRIDIRAGSRTAIKGKFDVVLANINRNVLVEHISSYNRCLLPEGEVRMSGFYASDIPIIAAKAEKFGWEQTGMQEREGWCLLAFRKPGAD